MNLSMVKKLKAVLFDLDGVLVDTLHYHYLAWQKQFERMGSSISELTVLLHEGRNSREILPILLEEGNVKLSKEMYEQFIESKRAYYRKIVDVQFFPGAIEVVIKLKEKGYKLAIVTACADKTMRKSLSPEYRKLFNLIQTGDDVTRAKPNPDPYELARKKLNFEKEECIVIENAPLGIEAAKNAGIYCVGITSTLSKKYLAQADVIIPRLTDLLTLPLFNGQS